MGDELSVVDCSKFELQHSSSVLVMEPMFLSNFETTESTDLFYLSTRFIVEIGRTISEGIWALGERFNLRCRQHKGNSCSGKYDASPWRFWCGIDKV